MSEAKNDLLKQMDADAFEARKELEQHLDQWQAKDVALWCKRWYLKAGHKRLGRILVDAAKKFEK